MSSSWKVPKTVLGNHIEEWDLAKIPGRPKAGRWTGKDDQLWRCRRLKKFEASLLSTLPPGACFVDAGAHFGDTIVTMALYARDTLHREDIRFVAFEPNPTKACFIEHVAKMNGFDNSDLFRVICCVLGDKTINNGAMVRKNRAKEKEWCEFDGRTSYSLVSSPSEEDEGDSGAVCLDVTSQGGKSTPGDDVDDESSSCSSTTSSAPLSLLDIHRLDDYFDLIHPLGFLHIDVEGWEARVIDGACSLLSTNDATVGTTWQCCYVVAETFSKKEARRRGPGFSETHEEDILNAMSPFSFTRGDDVVDTERNLFFARRANCCDSDTEITTLKTD